MMIIGNDKLMEIKKVEARSVGNKIEYSLEMIGEPNNFPMGPGRYYHPDLGIFIITDIRIERNMSRAIGLNTGPSPGPATVHISCITDHPVDISMRQIDPKKIEELSDLEKAVIDELQNRD